MSLIENQDFNDAVRAGTPLKAERTPHTPGPWTYRKARSGEDRWWVEAGRDDKNSKDWYVAQAEGRGAANESNARLIAAAPDLLSALKALSADLQSDVMPELSAVVARAEAAIAKAEGK